MLPAGDGAAILSAPSLTIDLDSSSVEGTKKRSKRFATRFAQRNAERKPEPEEDTNFLLEMFNDDSASIADNSSAAEIKPKSRRLRKMRTKKNSPKNEGALNIDDLL